MPKVLIADQLSPAAIAIFKERGVDAETKTGLSKDELLKIIGDYDGLAVRSATKVNAEVLKAAKRLKVIGRAGIGVDNIDVPGATAAGIIVMNTPFGNSITTAEHAIALMMALARDIPAANASTHAGKWEKNRFMGVELYGKTLGLIGCGNIGSIVADRGKGLKMRVVAFDREVPTVLWKLNANDVSPTLWRGRIAWTREYGSGKDANPVVYTKTLTAPRSQPSKRLPGVPTVRCAQESGLVEPPCGPTTHRVETTAATSSPFS